MEKELKIDASELKNEGSEIIQALANFLKEKTSSEVTNESNKMTVKGDSETVSKKYLRMLMKKFLHKQELRDVYRVISDKEDTLKIKERKFYEEE